MPCFMGFSLLLLPARQGLMLCFCFAVEGATKKPPKGGYLIYCLESQAKETVSGIASVNVLLACVLEALIDCLINLMITRSW